MNAIAQSTFNPSLAVINGTIKTTSLKVAEHFGKRHDRVLRAINNLECSPEFTESNFGVSEYKDASGKSNPYYEMTKDGFTFLAMGFTGKEAAKWKEAYINAFNKMAEQLSSNPLQLESSTITKVQEGVLFNKVKDIAGGSGKIRAELWSRFQKHYSLSSYKYLPADKYEDAIQYLEAKQKEYLGNVEMFYISSKEIEDRVKTLVGELVEKPKQDALTINLKFPDGMRTMTMKFETSEFQHGRWLVSLMDGNLSIQAMPNDVLCLTTDKWIDYMTQERGYVVGKKLN